MESWKPPILQKQTQVGTRPKSPNARADSSLGRKEQTPTTQRLLLARPPSPAHLSAWRCRSLCRDLPCPGPGSAAASMLRSRGQSRGYPANFLRWRVLRTIYMREAQKGTHSYGCSGCPSSVTTAESQDRTSEPQGSSCWAGVQSRDGSAGQENHHGPAARLPGRAGPPTGHRHVAAAPGGPAPASPEPGTERSPHSWEHAVIPALPPQGPGQA